MNEKVNIIKKTSGVTVHNLDANIKRNVSKGSFRIGLDDDTGFVGIYTFNERLHNTQIENITIQDNTGSSPGTPEQLTLANFDELTDGLNDSKGGAGGDGDMLKSVYDTNDNGIVDDSEKLGGKLPSEFATSEQGGKADSAIQGVKVNGTELVPDSDKKVDVSVPTNNNQLANGAGYQTASQVNNAISDHNTSGTAHDDIRNDITSIQSNYVRKSGDTMTGALKLPSPTADNDASNKKYVDDKISALESNALTFKGFISTTEPTIDVREGNLWYQPASALDTPDVNFPWQVKTYTSGAWSSTTTAYTPDAGDRWANVDDNSSGWYYEGQVWHKLDFGGSTFDSDEFDTSGGVVSLKPSGVQAITDPKVINLTNHAATVNYEIRPFVPYAFVDDANIGYGLSISITDSTNIKSSFLNQIYAGSVGSIQATIPANTAYIAFWDGVRWMLNTNNGFGLASSVTNDPNSVPSSRVLYNALQAKANATIVKEVTIAVAGWQGSAAPYSVTISDTDITDSRLILVNPVTASYNDYKEADIYPETASSTDSFTLYANEEKPVNPITIQYSILS